MTNVKSHMSMQSNDLFHLQAACSCDICEGHQDHSEVLAKMRRSVFCPIVASNVQSSRRLSEAVLSGCIPVSWYEQGTCFNSLSLAYHLPLQEFEPELNHTIFIRSGHSLELLQDVRPGSCNLVQCLVNLNHGICHPIS